MEIIETSQPMSPHFEERLHHRGLRPAVMQFILDYGEEFHAAGAAHLTVIAARLPESVRSCPEARQAQDWILVVSEDGVLITCYRRPHATRFLRTKPKRRLSRSQVRALRARRQSRPGLLAAA